MGARRQRWLIQIKWDKLCRMLNMIFGEHSFPALR